MVSGGTGGGSGEPGTWLQAIPQGCGSGAVQSAMLVGRGVNPGALRGVPAEMGADNGVFARGEASSLSKSKLPEDPRKRGNSMNLPIKMASRIIG